MTVDLDRQNDMVMQLAVDSAAHIVPSEVALRQDGRVLVSRRGTRTYLHRELYRVVIGPLGPHEFLLTTCHVHGCANPYHYLVSTTSSLRRRVCRNGHRYTPEDENPDGSHTCRLCAAERRSRAPRRGGRPQWQIQRDRLFCPYQHPYVPDNTYEYPTPSGGTRRKCKTCTLARRRGEDPANVTYP